MTREESAKLLALIKVAYPTAYRDMDSDMANATVNMWQVSFPAVPYAVMQLAFDRFRRVNKFPPTVAEMTEELQRLYWAAAGEAVSAKSVGDGDKFRRCEYIMSHTWRYGNYEPSINFSSISEDVLLEHEKHRMIGDGNI